MKSIFVFLISLSMGICLFASDGAAIAHTEAEGGSIITCSTEANKSSEPASASKNGTVGGIPIWHLILFGSGSALCVSVLIVLRLQKNRHNDAEPDDNERLPD